jgi:hypothetical protein
MGHRRTRRNRRTKSRRYRKHKGGDGIFDSTSSEDKKNEDSGVISSFKNWLEDPDIIPKSVSSKIPSFWSSSSSQPSTSSTTQQSSLSSSGGKRRRRKHRRTYKK